MLWKTTMKYGKRQWKILIIKRYFNNEYPFHCLQVVTMSLARKLEISRSDVGLFVLFWISIGLNFLNIYQHIYRMNFSMNEVCLNKEDCRALSLSNHFWTRETKWLFAPFQTLCFLIRQTQFSAQGSAQRRFSRCALWTF